MISNLPAKVGSIILLFFLMFLGPNSIAKNLNSKEKNFFVESSLESNIAFQQLVNQPNSLTQFQKDYFVFTHGKPGALLVDGQWLQGERLKNWLQQLPNIAGKPIRIFACEFGKSNKGEKAVAELSKALGVAVSASDDITGQNGDWNLEVGEAFNDFRIENFKGNLQWTLADTCASCDFDGDGVINKLDIDADNDGVLNAVENPTCYYNSIEASDLITITSDFAFQAGFPLSNAIDGLTTTNARLTATAVINTMNMVFFEVTPLSAPLNISSLEVQIGADNISNNTSFWKLEGFNGTSWVSMSDSITIQGISLTRTFNNTKTPNDEFFKFRVIGVNVGTAAANGRIIEITLNVNKFGASAHPKPGCNVDFDGDGFLNQFDLDADSDACHDAYEAQVTGATNNGTITDSLMNTSVGTNGLKSSLESSDYTYATVNYPSKYKYFATSALLNYCNDKDGDGVSDVVDIDDDNDGVLDNVECANYPNFAAYTNTAANPIVTTTN